MGQPRPTPAEAADRRAAISSRGMAEAIGELRTFRSELERIIGKNPNSGVADEVRAALTVSRHRYRA